MGICNSFCGNNSNKDKTKPTILFAKITNNRIIKNYKITTPPLGQGKYCQVLLIKSLKNPNDLHALKVTYKHKITGNFEKKTLNQAHEAKVGMELENDFIVKAYEFFDDDKAFYLICELCNGPTLLAFINEHIRTGKILAEKDAAEIFRQLLEAVKHIHELKLAHRDIKLENIIFYTDEENDLHIKLADFGICCQFKDDEERSFEKCGTPNYLAPEVLDRCGHNYRCDLWSLGVVLYVILGYKFPIKASMDKDQKFNITDASYSFDDNNRFKQVSSEAIIQIKQQLQIDPNDRITCEEALKSPWFNILCKD